MYIEKNKKLYIHIQYIIYEFINLKEKKINKEKIV